jgi:diguanylate cyclase (GGDEF)-like protein
MLTFKYERKFSDGTTRWVKNEVNFITDVDSGHLCIMLSAKDINAIKLKQQRLFEDAQLDSMTKLLNHKTSMERINKILYEENDKQHALFMLDIDNFKSLNDTLGHQAGDKFLIDFANELKNRFRETDIVGRIGGDEFFALMKNIFDRGQIERRAMDILDIIEETAQQFPEVKLGGSIGISLYPKDGTNLDVLYTKADEALYESKRNGKNQYKFAE